MYGINTAARRSVTSLALLVVAVFALGCGRSATPAASTATPVESAPAATQAPMVTEAPAATAQPSPSPAVNPSASPLTSPLAAGGGSAEPAIIVQRGGGLAGVSDLWTVYPDGRVLDAKGNQQQMAGADRVTAALAALDQLGFFRLQDSYGKGTKCRDCFNYEVTVNSSGRTKTVTFVEGDNSTPAELSQAIAEINKLINPAR